MRGGAGAVPDPGGLLIAFARRADHGGIDERSNRGSDCGEVPLRIVAPFFRDRGRSLQRDSGQAHVQQAGGGSARRWCARASLHRGQIRKSGGSSPGQRALPPASHRKIVPRCKQQRLEHRQGRPRLLAFWRRIERRQTSSASDQLINAPSSPRLV